MNLSHIETLAHQSKQGNKHSREQLAKHFTPLIINLSTKYKIQGYDFNDLMGECYKALFLSLNNYDITKHKFVAFATTSIKNSLKKILRNTKRRSHLEGLEILTVTDNLEHSLMDNTNLEENLCEKDLKAFIKTHLTALSKEEREIISFLFYKNKTLKEFSIKKNMKYSAAWTKKKLLLEKLKLIIELS